MITHEILDHLEQFVTNCHEGRNERLMEHAVEYLQDSIRAIQEGRKTGQETVSFVLKKAAESHLKTLRDRADHWEEKLMREEPPEHIKELPDEAQLLWIRAFRAEFKKTGSVGMSNMVADEAVEREYGEGA